MKTNEKRYYYPKKIIRKIFMRKTNEKRDNYPKKNN